MIGGRGKAQITSGIEHQERHLERSDNWVEFKICKNKLTLYLVKVDAGLPWWCSGWESGCQCRGHGFEPWSGKIPHTAEQLSPCTTTTEPAL